MLKQEHILWILKIQQLGKNQISLNYTEALRTMWLKMHVGSVMYGTWRIDIGSQSGKFLGWYVDEYEDRSDQSFKMCW